MRCKDSIEILMRSEDPIELLSLAQTALLNCVAGGGGWRRREPAYGARDQCARGAGGAHVLAGGGAAAALRARLTR